TAHVIRLTHNCRHCDTWVLEQGLFNFGRSDAVSAGENDVIGTTREVEIAVLLLGPEIAGSEVVTVILTARLLRLLPVPQKFSRIRGGNTDFTNLVGLNRFTLVVQDRDVESWQLAAHR